jgi:hypothetical protein
VDNHSIYYEYERKRCNEKMCPFRALWLRTVDKIDYDCYWHEDENDLAMLSDEEKVYYATKWLKRELRGGFRFYFYNTRCLTDALVEPSLIRIGDEVSLALYRQAKELLFWSLKLPKKGEVRDKITDDLSKRQDLDELSVKIWSNINTLDIKLKNFAINEGLLMPAWQ